MIVGRFDVAKLYYANAKDRIKCLDGEPHKNKIIKKLKIIPRERKGQNKEFGW